MQHLRWLLPQLDRSAEPGSRHRQRSASLDETQVRQIGAPLAGGGQHPSAQCVETPTAELGGGKLGTAAFTDQLVTLIEKCLWRALDERLNTEVAAALITPPGAPHGG